MKKPFPWVCGSCGEAEVWPLKTNYTARINRDGKMWIVPIEDLKIPTCKVCKAQVFFNEVNNRIEQELRKVMSNVRSE